MSVFENINKNKQFLGGGILSKNSDLQSLNYGQTSLHLSDYSFLF